MTKRPIEDMEEDYYGDGFSNAGCWIAVMMILIILIVIGAVVYLAIRFFG